MMRVPGAYATAVRDLNGHIQTNRHEFKSITELYPQLIRHQIGSIRGWLTDTDFYDIGIQMINDYWLILEVTGLVLAVSVIGALTMAKIERKN